jgi:hypothetical protein
MIPAMPCRGMDGIIWDSGFEPSGRVRPGAGEAGGENADAKRQRPEGRGAERRVIPPSPP